MTQTCHPGAVYLADSQRRKIKLPQRDGELRVNDLPIRRFYRKTLKEMVDSAFRHVRRKK